MYSWILFSSNLVTQLIHSGKRFDGNVVHFSNQVYGSIVVEWRKSEGSDLCYTH